MPLDSKCCVGTLTWLFPDTCVVVNSLETESGFIAEEHMSTVGYIPIKTVYEVGSMIDVLMNVGSLYKGQLVLSNDFL